MRRIAPGLNGNGVVNKGRAGPSIPRFARNERIVEQPKDPAMAEIDGKGTIRTQPPRVGAEQLVGSRPGPADLRTPGQRHANR
jgi:hypothetical protein